MKGTCQPPFLNSRHARKRAFTLLLACALQYMAPLWRRHCVRGSSSFAERSFNSAETIRASPQGTVISNFVLRLRSRTVGLPSVSHVGMPTMGSSYHVSHIGMPLWNPHIIILFYSMCVPERKLRSLQHLWFRHVLLRVFRACVLACRLMANG